MFVPRSEKRGDTETRRALRRQLREIDVALVRLRLGDELPPERVVALLEEPLSPRVPGVASSAALGG